MSTYPTIFSSSPLHAIILWVIAMHLLLLGLGVFWNPAPPPPKARPKVMVQTVPLQPFQSPTVQKSTPAPAAIPVQTPSIPVSVPIESPPPEVTPLPAPTTPPASTLPPPPAKTEESKPKPETPKPKPTPKEKPKTSPKPIAPVKKTSEPAKKSTKTEKAKSKPSEDTEKKRQKEQAEKKQQQEKAEAEKKRQQEIAAVQEAAKQKEQTLLAKAKENLAKMGETRDKISSSSSSVNLEATALPKELGSLQVDALPLTETGNTSEWGTKEISYSDEVAYRLKMALKLPDYGAVKIKLTLDRTGKVIKVETIQSESKKNKTYVESKIPTLLFSSFGQRFQGVQQNTFVITLQNDS